MALILWIMLANPTITLYSNGACCSEKEKVEGEELQKWLRLVVAPTELALFVKSAQESVVPLQIGS